MDSKDKHLILLILLAFALWGVIDFLFSPDPVVFLYQGEANAAATIGQTGRVAIRESEGDDALSLVVPKVEPAKIVRTEYEKPHEPLLETADRDEILDRVREEPVIELTGFSDPTVIKKEGGTITVALRVKAYYEDVYNVSLQFALAPGWEYIPGTTTNRFSMGETGTEMRLASLEDIVGMVDGQSVLARYVQESAVEPTASLIGDTETVNLTWAFQEGLETDEAAFIEFPLQTNGNPIAGSNAFVVKATAYDREDLSNPDATPLFAELILRVDILDDDQALIDTRPIVDDWEQYLISCDIDRGYREPLSGVGF